MTESPTLTFEQICEKEPLVEPLVERLRLGCIEEARRARRSSDPYCSDRF
jgi:hypothetical protein